MELKCAQNLLMALNIPFTVQFYAARKPLNETDSVRIVRHKMEAGKLQLLTGSFLTTAGESAKK
jgi:hypothetical protein